MPNFLPRIRAMVTALMVLCALGVTACSAPEDVVIKAGTPNRILGDTFITWGTVWVNDDSSEKIKATAHRSVELQANRAFAEAVYGVQYAVEIGEGEDAKTPTIRIGEIAVLPTLRDSVLVSVDKVAVPERNASLAVSQVETTLRGNLPNEAVRALEERPSYRCEVEIVYIKTTSIRHAVYRAIRAVLSKHYEGQTGKFQGTLFIIQNSPRVYMASDPKPTVWATGAPPKIPTGDRFHEPPQMISVAGRDRMIADIEIVVGNDVTVGRTLELTDLDARISPKKPGESAPAND